MRSGIGGTNLFAHIEGHEEHDDKINKQRYGDADDIKGDFYDVFTFQREHDKNGKQQGDQGNGADFRDKLFMIPFLVLYIDKHEAGNYSGNKWYAQINENAFSNLADGDIDFSAFKPKQGRQYCDKDLCIHGEEQHLEDGVEGNQASAVFGVAFGKVIPDNDHGNTAGKADHNQSLHVGGVVA